MNKEKLKRTFPIPQVLQVLNQQYSFCEICGLPWNHCTPKTIFVKHPYSVFATCEYCWEHSDLNSIKIAYINMYDKWIESKINIGINMYDKWIESEINIRYSLTYLLRQVEVEYIRTHRK
jgi:transcription elongation factor Elf1